MGGVITISVVTSIVLNTIATEDDAQRQAADTELTQLRTMIGSLQDSLADFQKK